MAAAVVVGIPTGTIDEHGRSFGELGDVIVPATEAAEIQGSPRCPRRSGTSVPTAFERRSGTAHALVDEPVTTPPWSLSRGPAMLPLRVG